MNLSQEGYTTGPHQHIHCHGTLSYTVCVSHSGNILEELLGIYSRLSPRWSGFILESMQSSAQLWGWVHIPLEPSV